MKVTGRLPLLAISRTESRALGPNPPTKTPFQTNIIFKTTRHIRLLARRTPRLLYSVSSAGYYHERSDSSDLLEARNTDLNGVVTSMKQMEDRFNKKFQYPYVFLNDQPFNDAFKKYSVMSGCESEFSDPKLLSIDEWLLSPMPLSNLDSYLLTTGTNLLGSMKLKLPLHGRPWLRMVLYMGVRSLFSIRCMSVHIWVDCREPSVCAIYLVPVVLHSVVSDTGTCAGLTPEYAFALGGYSCDWTAWLA